MTFDPSDMIDWNMMHTPPRFASKVNPDDPKLVSTLEAALGKKP